MTAFKILAIYVGSCSFDYVNVDRLYQSTIDRNGSVPMTSGYGVEMAGTNGENHYTFQHPRPNSSQRAFLRSSLDFLSDSCFLRSASILSLKEAGLAIAF